MSNGKVKRVPRVPFIPSCVNFSTLPEGYENTLYDDHAEQQDVEIDKEILLLKTLNRLDSDKERAVLLLEILREYGFAIDYNSCAKALGIQLRWFMRVKKAVHTKVKEITTNN